MPDITTRVLTAHVPLPMAEQLDRAAARLERSRGWIVKQAIAAWLAQDEEKERLTHEALSAVDAGHTVDHAAVQAWVDSLDTDHQTVPPHSAR